MKKFSYNTTHGQGGNALIIVMVLFVVVSLSVAAGLIAPVLAAHRIATNNLESKRSYYIAESGVEDVYYRLQKSKQVSATESLVLGAQTAITTVTDISGGGKQISAIGDAKDRNRSVTLRVVPGEGVAFNYGMQVGNGGLVMSNTATINGNVYVNGDIIGSNSAKITGTAFAADRTAEVIDQVNDTGTPTDAILFGNAAATQDAAQSFIPVTSDVITQVSVYIKKVGAPGNVTVRIAANSSGKPATSSLTTGTLSASSITASYGWVNVVLSPNVALSAGTTYWLVLDASTSASNYYNWGANNAEYASGLGKLGQYGGTTWNNTSPSGLDAFFKAYLGGVNSTISGMIIGQAGVGSASAHTVSNSTIAGNLYCKVDINNSKNCDTTQPDPQPLNFPISDAQIQGWKDDAVLGGTDPDGISLSGSETLNISSKKIVGNLTLSNNAILTISGTLWVTGNISLSNSSRIQVSSSYGSRSGAVIADGTVSTSNSASFSGSGTAGSYLMMLTTSTSSSAISISNSAGTVILVAPYGTVSFSNTAGAKEVIAKTVSMSNSSTLTYESGLMNVNFSSGPSGAWTVQSWKETE